MKKSQIVAAVTGGVFILLGLALLGTLLDVFESSDVYGLVIPMVLIFSGITTLQASSRHKTSVGYGLLAIGTITLLIRFNVIRGDVVNGLLGAALLIAGASIIARLPQKQNAIEEK